MYNSDGDLLIVPQQGKLNITPELGRMEVNNNNRIISGYTSRMVLVSTLVSLVFAVSGMSTILAFIFLATALSVCEKSILHIGDLLLVHELQRNM